MPDIQLRFNRDMLVLSGPIDATLERLGFDAASERESLMASEPETITEALRLQDSSGAPCLVTPTAGITRARLAHVRLSDAQSDIAQAALAVVRGFSPQHVLAEIGPCGLPLDPGSQASLRALRDQYSDAVRAFGEEGIDAFVLTGLGGESELLCALMGVRKETALPVFAQVVVDARGNLADGSGLEGALELMEEYEADVVGFASSAPLEAVAALAERACAASELPLFVQLDVLPGAYDERENPYASPDLLMGAALRLRAAGVQFLRAGGQALATHTGALAVACEGLDPVR